MHITIVLVFGARGTLRQEPQQGGGGMKEKELVFDLVIIFQKEEKSPS